VGSLKLWVFGKQWFVFGLNLRPFKAFVLLIDFNLVLVFFFSSAALVLIMMLLLR
jgi:hypothetical protein